MRWLLKKDLVILARSRLLVGALVVYPIVIALLIGFAISRSPGRQRVAILDETAPGATVQVGSERVSAEDFASGLLKQVQPVTVHSRAEAEDKVKSGDVVAAVVIPRSLTGRLSSEINQASLEVIYNGNALEQSLVHSTIESAVSQANLGFSEQIQRAAAQAIDALLRGGNLEVLGAPPNLIALSQVAPAIRRAIPRLPPGHERASLERVEQFAEYANQNLALSRNVLQTISQPIRVDSRLLHGRKTPLDTFAVVVAVSISLMFVCVLLAAGGVALEREEHALPRLVRGLVSRWGLLAEKTLLAAGCAFVLAFAMLAGIGAFVTLDWGRVGQWLAALAVAAVAFGALGVAIGALARDVRAASLLAFLLALPLAFLALVPSGAVSGGFEEAIRIVSFVFPFKAALEALDAAVNGASPSIGGPLAHLAGLTIAFMCLGRLGLRSAD
jgi:ABC-2 type transport system permease protein